MARTIDQIVREEIGNLAMQLVLATYRNEMLEDENLKLKQQLAQLEAPDGNE